VGGVRKLRLMANADAEYRTQNAEHRYGYGAKDMQIRAGRHNNAHVHVLPPDPAATLLPSKQIECATSELWQSAEADTK